MRALGSVVALLVSVGSVCLDLHAQQMGPPPSGGVQPMCAGLGCGGGSVTVTPVPASVATLSNLTEQLATFSITNETPVVVLLKTPTCTRTGTISTCGLIDILAPDLGPGETTTATVTYSTGSSTGAGTLKLKVLYGTKNAAGIMTFTVDAPVAPVAPTLALRNRPHQLDRALCLTTGAGEAAVQCGDLVVAHAMPAYRTMGRDRSLTLVYTSAAAVPTPVVVAAVNTGNQTLTGVTATLLVGRAAQTQVASALYAPWTGTRQIVLGFDASDTTAYPTGIYDYTLKVATISSQGTSPDAILTGQMVIVNRRHSPLGRGWSLAGVERLHIEGTRLLWVGGDGSARIYQPTGTPKQWVAPKGAFRDTITFAGSAYTRTLRHQVRVIYNDVGYHTASINRIGQTTSFAYDNGRLVRVTVPSTDTLRQYLLSYTNGYLDAITDPAGRQLDGTVTAGQLTSLLDPDGRPVSFAYDLVGRMKSRTNRLGYTTQFWFTNGLRVREAWVPYGPTGSLLAKTRYEPWDEKGLALAPTNQVAVDTSQVFTTVLGPRVNVDDDARFWFDSLAAPSKVVNALNATTRIKRQSAVYPALVTEVVYPNNRIVTMRYDTTGSPCCRGNLRILRDSTSHLANGLSTKGMTYTYGTAFPDAPVTAKDALNRTTTYTYHSTLGLLETETSPRGHVTRYTYELSGALKGQISRITEANVETWHEAAGTGDDESVADVLDSLVTRYGYDDRGNLDSVAAPHGAVTSFKNDTAGRAYRSWDPFGMVTELTFDPLNRVTQQTQYTTPYAVANPFGLGTPGTLDLTQVVAGDSARPFNLALPATVVTSTTQGAVGPSLLTGPLSATRSYGYEARPLMREEKDGLQQAETSTFNEAGQVVTVLKRTGHVISYDYDVLGRLTAMWFPARTLSYTAEPLQPAITVPKDSTRYKYDPLTNDLLFAETTEDSVLRSYYADGSVASRLQFRKVGARLQDALYYAYNAAGQRTMLVHNTDTVLYAYHGTTGDLTTMTVKWGDDVTTPNRTITFTWDALGRRRQVAFSSQPTISYRYDKLGLLRRLKSTHTDTLPSGNNLDFTYVADVVDARGLLLHTKLRCGGNPGPLPHGACEGGVGTMQERTSRYNRLGMLVWSNMDNRIDSLWYDAAGNLVMRREPTVTKMRHSFGMQASTNRLLTDTDTTGRVRYYAYDANGARQDEWLKDGAQRNISQNRYYYDALGRTTGTGYWATIDGTYQFRRDSTSCRYDPDGQLLKPCDTGAPLLTYDGVNVVGIPGTATSPRATFFSGPGVDDALIGLMRNGSGIAKELIWVTDGAGRQFAVGGPTGEDPATLGMDFVTGMSAYFGWQWVGGTRRSYGFDAQRQAPRNDGAQGAEFAVFRNRLYDPKSGRWLQEDPIGVAGGINLYQFNGNNPAMFTDPFGLKADTVNVAGSLQDDVNRCRTESRACDAEYREADAAPFMINMVEGSVQPFGTLGGYTDPASSVAGQPSGSTVYIDRSTFGAASAKIGGLPVGTTELITHELNHANAFAKGTDATTCPKEACAIPAENRARRDLQQFRMRGP